MKHLKWNKQVIVNQIQMMINKGESLYYKDAVKNHSRLVHAATSKRYYGSWIKALKSVRVNYLYLMKRRRKEIESGCRPYVSLSINNPELDKVYNEFIRSQRIYRECSEKTIKHYRDAMIKLQKYLDSRKVELSLANMNYFYLRPFIRRQYKAKLARKTIADIYYCLRRFLAYCVNNKYIDENPMNRIPQPRYINNYLCDSLSPDELHQLFGFLMLPNANTNVSARNVLVVGLLSLCGLRSLEAARLKIADINLKDGYIFVRKGKFKKQRLVPINDTMRILINNYLSARKSSRIRYLLLTKYMEMPLRPQGIYEIVVESGQKAKLGRSIYPHLLRHSFASILLENGADLKAIQDLLGHSDIKTTSRYIKSSANYLRREILKHPLINKQFTKY